MYRNEVYWLKYPNWGAALVFLIYLLLFWFSLFVLHYVNFMLSLCFVVLYFMDNRSSQLNTNRVKTVKNRYDKKCNKNIGLLPSCPFNLLPLHLSLWVLACPFSFLFFLTDDWILFTLLTGVIWACQDSDINQFGLDWISQRPRQNEKKNNKCSSKTLPSLLRGHKGMHFPPLLPYLSLSFTVLPSLLCRIIPSYLRVQSSFSRSLGFTPFPISASASSLLTHPFPHPPNLSSQCGLV